MSKILPAVIGLGYVGLPIFARLNAKLKTTGFDINLKRVKQLKKLEDINSEIKKNELILKNNSILTNNINELKKNNFFIITVPTPIHKSKKPDLKHLYSACKILSKCLKNNDIVFFESTVYPGLTKQLKNKFFKNKKIWLGYSPERINPGDKINNLKNIKKIVAFEKCPKLIKKKILYTYNIISKNLVLSKSLENAEMSKVIENVQRDINIAFMNEILMICKKLDLNFNEVMSLAKTKWNFLNFSPGLVGGHCLPVDPFYLYYLSKNKGYNANFILAGRTVNDHLYKFVEYQVKKKIIQNKCKKILICGVSYKPNVSDLRNSLAFKIFKNLKGNKNLKVNAYDPVVNKDVQKKYKIMKNVSNLSNFDLIVILVNHKIYLKKLKINKRKFEEKYLDLFNYLK